jgi:hypothetical protein
MIYLLDKPNNKIIPCEETDFKSQKILERQHLEKWVESYPAILGEKFLVITTEYDKFDKTNERLDILAIDKDGNLTIIELKRDDSGKNVDLQAVKYAAYCSNLRLDDITHFYKEHEEKTGEHLTDELARKKILQFIENDVFEEISDRPRIILVSRQFRPEVTASVLWLRKFGIDISCVKLSLYDIGGGGIAFESNILIPLPEAKDFIIEAERKEGSSLTVSQEGYIEFYKELISRLKVQTPRDYPTPQPRYYYQIPTGIGSVHYEWSFHGRPRDSFNVEFHFEKASKEENLEIFSHVESKIPQLEEALQEKVTIQKEWQANGLRFFIAKAEGEFSEELKEWAVQKMATFYKILQPVFSKLG